MASSSSSSTSSSKFSFVLGCFVTVLTITSLPVSTYSQCLFVFGDSLYDSGNKQFLTTDHVASSSPPYGVSVGESTGRWSDGLIVPDYIAEFMGISRAPPIYKDGADFSHGANFAVADATVLRSRGETINFPEQANRFSQMKNKWTKTEREGAIYLFYVGAEDYLDFIKTHRKPNPHKQLNFVTRVVDKVTKVIRDIYNSGGRRFAFQNLAPLGCLPIVKQQYGTGDKCVALPSEIAKEHNKQLLVNLAKLAEELDGFLYTVFDFFGSTQRRVDNPLKYIFETGNTACCGSGTHNAFGCGIENKKSCTHPSKYLFFDGRHYSSAAYEQMAQLMWSADPTVIGPFNLRELLVYPTNTPLLSANVPKTHWAIKIEMGNSYSLASTETENEPTNPFAIPMGGAQSFGL